MNNNDNNNFYIPISGQMDVDKTYQEQFQQNYYYNKQPIQRPTNRLAIIGFILSFVTIISGFVISIIAFKKIKKTKEKGKGFAVAGITIGAYKLGIVLIVVISAIVSNILWNNVKENIIKSTYCYQAYNCESNGDGTATCLYIDDTMMYPEEITCYE